MVELNSFLHKNNYCGKKQNIRFINISMQLIIKFLVQNYYRSFIEKKLN